MTENTSDLGFINKTKRSSKDFSSLIIERKNNKIESLMNKGKKSSKYYYEDPVKISPLDNASNRANEIAKEMKNKAEKNKISKDGSSVLGATFIRN